MIPTAKKAVLAVMVMWMVLLIPCLCRAADEQPSLRGSIEDRYRYRSDGNVTDQDMFQRLSLDYFRPWRDAQVGFVFLGLLEEDLDKNPPANQYFPFREVSDAYKGSTAGWLYLAYAELDTQGFVQSARVGRQEILELEPIAFDGGLVSVRLWKKISLTAFGGVPVNLFESDHNGDSVAGAYVEYRVLRSLALTAGYLRLRDRVEMLDGAKETLHADLVAMKAFWRPMRGLDFTLRGTMQDGEFRDATARASFRNYDWDVLLTAYYAAQFIERDAAPLNQDPFAIILGPYQPYEQAGFTAYKGIGKYLGVEGGAMFRELFNKGKESVYNHDYSRYLATLYLYKLPFKGSQWTVGADWWSSPGNVHSQSIRGEFMQRFMKRGKFFIGATYDLYKVDELTGQETSDVRTYYIGATIPTGKHFYVGADYRFEDSDVRQTDAFNARLGYEF